MVKDSCSKQKSIFTLILRALVLIFLFTGCKTRLAIPNFDTNTMSLSPTKIGFEITGEAVDNSFGYSVNTAGDINGDGYDDILVGAYKKNGSRGAVYVIYGGRTFSFSNLDLGSLKLDPATTGFVILGVPSDGLSAFGEMLGCSVSTAGDINKDGYDDIILGAYFHKTGKGAAYVIYGGPTSSFSNIDLVSQPLNPAKTGFTVKGASFPGWLGYSVSTAGDINKDGYDDIIIGAPSSGGFPGNVYVIYGGEKSSFSNIDFSVQTLNPATTGFMITTATSSWVDDSSFGWSVSTAGDINKDGYDDILIGATGYTDQGAAYVIYGGEKSSLGNMVLTTTPLDPATTGFKITSISYSAFIGYSVSSAGDINKDGYDDIIVGDMNRGEVYVIYGGKKSSLQNFALSPTTLDPAATGFSIIASVLGRSVSRAGDVNGDGFDDIILGAGDKDFRRGEAYVIYGGPKSKLMNIKIESMTTKTGFILTGSQGGDYFGASVSTAGDINKDGYDDLIIGGYGVQSMKGKVSVFHSACLTEKDTCDASICQSCKNGEISSPDCDFCASNCLYFSNDISCGICNLGYFLVILPTGGICKECSSHCSICESEISCIVCKQGYPLSNSLCLSTGSPFSSNAEEKATKAVASAVTGVGGAVCVGNSRFPLSALVSKIVQNTRYLNLTVTDELAQIYQTWSTDMISWQVPNALSKPEDFKTSPLLFARFELDSPFLANFWPTIMTLILGLGVLVLCFVLEKLLKRINYQGKIYTLVQKLFAGSLNFVVIQVYGCLDDILFYLILDIKTNPFNSFYSWISIICAIGFLALGCLFVLSNLRIVKQYQVIKNEGLAKRDMKALKDFNERKKYWELFYSDFNDDDFLSQSTMAILLIRATLSSLIITALFEYPLMQTVFLIILDGSIVLFLAIKKPFTTLRATLAQYYFETITLLVHLCTFSLAMQDSMESSSEGLKNFLSTAIIYLNTALITGGISFMAIEIYKIISQRTKFKKYENLATQTVNSEDMAKHSMMNPQLRLENSISFPAFNPSMETNNFFLPDNELTNRTNPNIDSIVVRPKLKKVRIYQQ